ncbi:hypothetical protein DM860_009973 [Cuscuta australis]|uniref:Glycine-rich protein n=1 Tax=Cuscuta australis TaxID=267555 RepID=A0A328DG27_9ASTE|nr:hypothetical protein DM860_009973 [Cuscuta australis]
MKKYVRVILLLLLILLNLHHCPLHAGAANTNAPLPISGNEGVDRQIHIVGRRAGKSSSYRGGGGTVHRHRRRHNGGFVPNNNNMILGVLLCFSLLFQFLFL